MDGMGRFHVPGPKIVRLVLPAAFYSKLKEDRYAVVFRPSTYEETKKLAWKVFGPCLYNNDAFDFDYRNITLRCSVENQKGEWYWADIMPEDWEDMVNILAVEEIGVFFTLLNTYDQLSPTTDKFMLGVESETTKTTPNTLLNLFMVVVR
ncbi:hypothetical protein BDQ17DRAFT_1339156 [Cyathus striatus]|nr:hypothetical protein BDQ17DRAFT_1339156 [Cyathus striatus]